MLSVGTQNEKLHRRRLPASRPLARAASTGKLPQSCAPAFNRLSSFSPDLVRWNSTASSQYGLTPAPLVIAGPSGSGKSTLLKRLMEEFQDCFGFSVSRKSFSLSLFPLPPSL